MFAPYHVVPYHRIDELSSDRNDEPSSYQNDKLSAYKNDKNRPYVSDDPFLYDRINNRINNRIDEPSSSDWLSNCKSDRDPSYPMIDKRLEL